MNRTLAVRLWLSLLLTFGFFLPENTHAQYITNGSASNQGGSCYHLTEDVGSQAGTIFSNAPIDLSQPFSISGRYYFGDKDANGADGIVFIFATSNTALGTGGGGLGYQGITPSFAWEVDDYLNGSFSDPAADHMAIMQNGSNDHASGNNLVGPITIGNVEDDEEHCFNISWNPGANLFTASLDANTITYSGDIVNNIFGGNSSVYYGFSSATGGLSNLHRVCFGPPTIDPMVDVTICPGESVQLQADPDGLTYTWTPNPTLTPLNVSNPTATPTQTTTYSVNIGFACGGSAFDDVTVFVQQPPNATANSNSPICSGETLNLMASGGVSFSWSGPVNFSSGQQNPGIPNVNLTTAGTYTVTVTDAAGCTATASTDVIVYPPAVVAIVPVLLPVCENAGPFQLDALPTGGTWGGDVSPTGMVDPAALGPGTWTATYTATDPNGCVGTDEIQFEIVPVTVPAIDPAGPFCDTDPVQDLTASPSGGLWGGAALPTGAIVPSALGVGTHEVTYTYINADGCFGYDTAQIEILQGTTVTIDLAGPFCPSAPVQTLTANPSGGTWGGAANASGQVNPMTLGPGSHLVTYEFTQVGSCPGEDSIFIGIYEPPTANIDGMGTVCAGSGETVTLTITASGNGPYDVTYSIDNSSSTTITVSAGTTNLPTGTPGVYELLYVLDANGCPGTVSGSGIVEVVEAPEVTNLEIECDPTQTNYTVTFEVIGGDPATYTVTSAIPGTFAVNPPYIFTSDPIPSGGDYEFTVDDGNSCNPVTLSGNFSCQCVTDAGNMDLDPLTPCQDETAIATHLGDEVLDANDTLVFVIHDGNGNSLGTIFGTGGTPNFSLVPPMLPGVTYYISAVAGDNDGMGGVDLDDNCLSVSFGVPVTWTPLPTASISQDADICLGESATIVFSLTGNAPFDVTYTDGTSNFDLTNIFDGHSIQVSPSETTAYALEFVSDNSTPACSQGVSSSVTVTVNDPALTNENAEICEGESILLGGQMQAQSGTYFDTLSTVMGCDSVIVTELIVNELDTVYLNDSSCNPANVGTSVDVFTDVDGCDSTVITTVVFSETDSVFVSIPTCDPNGVGTFATTYATPDGCDSTVVETFYLVPTDSIFVTLEGCNPNEVGVFEEIFTNQFGCDSVVITEITLAPLDTVFVTLEVCDPAQAGIFTQTYLTLDGCDSTVVETVDLLPSDTTELFDTSCDPMSVGVFENIYPNQFGCDSTVILTIDFSEVDTTPVFSTTCDPALAGIFTSSYVTPEGCDSIVIETVDLLQSDTVPITSTTCDPAQAGIFTNVFPNQFGCDSTVIETVVLVPSDTIFIPLTTCEPQDTGTVIEVLTNQFGCDSTIITQTTLLPPNQCGVVFVMSGDTIPCMASEGSLTIDISQGQAPFDYEWEGTGTPSSGSGTLSGNPAVLNGLSGGTYSVTVTSANGLASVAQAEIVQVLPPVIDAMVTGVLDCSGTATGSATVSISGSYPPYQILWSNGETTPNIDQLVAGDYGVTVTGPFACEAIDGVSLDEPPPLLLIFTVNDLSCFGQNDGSIIAEASGGAAPYLYSLNGGDFLPENTFQGLPSGTYEITVQDANGCEISESIFVNAPVPVDVELGDDMMIDLGDDTTLVAVVNVPASSLVGITWSGLDTAECPTCLSQPLAPLITTTYSISVIAENGCHDEDDLTVFVDRRKSVYVPNAFSPNGDGINDVFFIFAKPNTVAEVKSFLVFDRWGETVFQYHNFEPNNPVYGWDGRYRGEEMDPAVFAWFAEIEFLDGEVVLFEGDVTLVK